MEKWTILFLSLILSVLSGNCFSQKSYNCESKHFRDSIVNYYTEVLANTERIYYNDARWQELCDSIIKICPDIAEAYQLKALPFTKYADYEKCFSLLDKAVQYDPVEFLPYRAFIKCIFTKDYEGAIVDFTRSDSLTKNSGLMDHSYQFFMGICNLELKKYDMAEINFKNDADIQHRAFRGEQLHYNSLLYTGIVQLEKGQYREAEKLLLKCLDTYSKHPEANYYLALVEEKLGNEILKHTYLENGREAYIQGLRLNEDNIYYSNYPKQVTLRDFDRALGKDVSNTK
ncbi:MAG: hypothetical protein QM763_15555 [Agriterribacter sp.]